LWPIIRHIVLSSAVERVVYFMYFISAFTDGEQLNESEPGGAPLE